VSHAIVNLIPPLLADWPGYQGQPNPFTHVFNILEMMLAYHLTPLIGIAAWLALCGPAVGLTRRIAAVLLRAALAVIVAIVRRPRAVFFALIVAAFALFDWLLFGF
jgi:hypothetical protein